MEQLIVHTVNIIVGGSYKSSVIYLVVKRSARKVFKVTARAYEMCIVEDELEATFDFNESVDILNLCHDVLVISLSITN